VTVVGSAITADPVASVTVVGSAITADLVTTADPVTTVASVDPETTVGPVGPAEATTAEAAATAKPLPAQGDGRGPVGQGYVTPRTA
jgi:hypothetical protein